MNCVVVYNGVTGTGKSRVIECIKSFYENTSYQDTKATYLGLTGISNPDIKGSDKISIGYIMDYSVIEPYSKLLVKMKDNTGNWVDSAEYNTVSSYLRDAESRKLLVNLKNTFELTYPGCSNRYVIKRIEEFVQDNVLTKPPYNRVFTLNFYFVSIREPENIRDFVKNCPYPTRTLLIDAPDSDKPAKDGLDSDFINGYDYDYTFCNERNGISNIFAGIQPVFNSMIEDFVKNTEIKQSDILRAANEDFQSTAQKDIMCIGYDNPFFVPITCNAGGGPV
jgi:hypothetical protein